MNYIRNRKCWNDFPVYDGITQNHLFRKIVVIKTYREYLNDSEASIKSLSTQTLNWILLIGNLFFFGGGAYWISGWAQCSWISGTGFESIQLNFYKNFGSMKWIRLLLTKCKIICSPNSRHVWKFAICNESSLVLKNDGTKLIAMGLFNLSPSCAYFGFGSDGMARFFFFLYNSGKR